MIIYESKELKALAEIAGKSTKDVSNIIIEQLTAQNIIDNDPGYYGAKIKEVYDRTVGVSKFLNLCEIIGLPKRGEYLITIINLQLFGEYECENCGGEMEITDSEQKCIGGDGRETPFEYVNIWEEKTCCTCGNRTRNEPDFE